MRSKEVWIQKQIEVGDAVLRRDLGRTVRIYMYIPCYESKQCSGRRGDNAGDGVIIMQSKGVREKKPEDTGESDKQKVKEKGGCETDESDGNRLKAEMRWEGGAEAGGREKTW